MSDLETRLKKAYWFGHADATQKLNEERDRLREELQSFRRVLEDTTVERDRLREAIEKHRRDMWGNGPVGHLYDKNLYAALQEDRDENHT